MEIELIVIFFGIALIYSSVGFGGGSSYLAVLALFFNDVPVIKTTALICNIAVVTGSIIQFHKAGHLNLKKTSPLVIASVPMAFLGSWFPIKDEVFFMLLGLSLLISSVIMFIGKVNSGEDFKNSSNNLSTGILGGLIGLLSGLVGIGGGIFLSPILNFMKWDRPKTIAASSAFFIFVNSVSGLLGQYAKGIPDLNFVNLWMLVIAVTAGGLIGSRLGIFRLYPDVVVKITGLLVLVASVEIISKHTNLLSFMK